MDENHIGPAAAIRQMKADYSSQTPSFFWSHDRQVKLAVFIYGLIFSCDIGDFSYFSLDWCSRRLELSAAYLSRCFNQYYGRPFSTVLTQRKMMVARELLLGAPMFDIDSIAGMTGYHSGNYFIKVFKREMGMTPYRYRKEMSTGLELPLKITWIAKELEMWINDEIKTETNGRFEHAVSVHGGGKKLRRKKRVNKGKGLK